MNDTLDYKNNAPNTLKTLNAQVEWSEQSLPKSTQFDDIYFSTAGAEEESEYVFLNANRLPERWAEDSNTSKPFTVVELGFGSGLNFLKTLQAWQLAHSRPARLHYIAIEKYPLRRKDLKRIHDQWPTLTNQSEEFLGHYKDHSHICHRLQLSHGVLVDLYFGDVLTRLQTLCTGEGGDVDCWYLDGFSPKLNRAMWSKPLFSEIAALSHSKTTLSTYSASGEIRKSLSEAGFAVERTKGFGKKRHMTIAHSLLISPKRKMPAWDTLPTRTDVAQSVTIVGAGLAGCSLAYSLANRGVSVQIVDKHPNAAAAASSIEQLALRPRLFRSASALSEFYLQSFLYTAAQLTLLDSTEPRFWHQTGVLQEFQALNKRNPLTPNDLDRNYNLQVLRHVLTEEASQLANLNLESGFMFIPSGGWVNPSELCRRYLDNPLIAYHGNTEITELTTLNESWHAHTGSPGETFESDAVVLCNSIHATTLANLQHLPLQGIRGQATYIEANGLTQQLQTVITGPRSLFPKTSNFQTISATYSNEVDPTPKTQDDLANLNASADWLKNHPIDKNVAVRNAVGIRCNSPDFVPVVGLAPDREQIEMLYGDLRLNAQAQFEHVGGYQQGLYLNVAHGSNGMATSPLCSEYLASLICNEISPLNMDMMAALNPNRFLIRDLKKQR